MIFLVGVLMGFWSVFVVPPCSDEASMKAGKEKKVVDIFGEWAKYEELSIEAAQDIELSPVLIMPRYILLYNFDFADHLIPYGVFNNLMSEHGIGVTQLSVSMTGSGNVYRASVLFSGTP